jgi:hypothetical protein
MFAAAFMFVSACSYVDPNEDATGEAAVGVSTQALSASSVTRVSLTISGPGMTPIVRDLLKTSGQWQGVVGNIPVGVNRVFHAEAFDAGNVKVYEGEATGVSIAKNQTITVVLVLQQNAAPIPFTNTVPYIDSATASSNAVSPSDPVYLSVAGHDVDPGDSIAFLWTATGGSLDNPSATSPVWTAPATEGVYALTVTVNDQKNATRALTVNVAVTAASGRGKGNVRATFNTWPEVTSVTAAPGRVDVNGVAALSVTAVDNDGDLLGYAWSDSGCGGVFSSPSARNPSWTAPPVAPVTGTCALRAVVTDGRGGNNTGTLTIQVGPPQSVLLAPVITASAQSAASIGAGDTVTFDVSATDPEGQALTFSWAASGGTLAAPTSSANASQVTWAPPATGGMFTVTATVTDASGLSSTRSFPVSLFTGCGVGGRYNVVTPSSPACLAEGTGIVIDNLTGLTWMAEEYQPPPDPENGDVFQNLAQATAYCASRGMRVPTKDEALAVAGTSYDACAFPCGGGTWTSTPAPVGVGSCRVLPCAWMVGTQGNTGAQETEYGSGIVRCVQ